MLLKCTKAFYLSFLSGPYSVFCLQLLRCRKQQGSLRKAGSRPCALCDSVPGQQHDQRAQRETKVQKKEHQENVRLNSLYKVQALQQFHQFLIVKCLVSIIQNGENEQLTARMCLLGGRLQLAELILSIKTVNMCKLVWLCPR